jgi:site-specific recombinase XerD
MDKLFQEFKDYLVLNGYSDLSYLSRLKFISKNLDLNNLTQEIVSNFIITQRKDKSANTMNNYIHTLKIFFKFKNLIIELPGSFKVDTKIPDYITPEYLDDKVIPTAECVFTRPERTKAILLFLYYTGIRQGEILKVKRKDIDLNSREVKLYQSKTKQERITYFPQKVANAFNVYFLIEPEGDNAFNVTKCTLTNIFRTLKPHFKDINLRPLLFRHSIGSYLLKQGADIRKVQEFFGHKNIQSTLHYCNVNNADIKAMYDKFIK